MPKQMATTGKGHVRGILASVIGAKCFLTQVGGHTTSLFVAFYDMQGSKLMVESPYSPSRLWRHSLWAERMSSTALPQRAVLCWGSCSSSLSSIQGFSVAWTLYNHAAPPAEDLQRGRALCKCILIYKIIFSLKTTSKRYSFVFWSPWCRELILR